MQEVSVKGDAKPITIGVRFDPKVASVKRIASTAKRALEQDAANRAPVKVVFEREKG